ncbi:polysaccharide biosynthesis protein CapD [Thermanaerovibrio acidaminovorans DSM 6589]|uniref:Polysaccharide biosynthesis protein CapD n=1 Tax=Thermanaerovibrio acidaminovorans (strain ATCC 49978 / DSM 6589 / Su883) TaxID=525903 RepID=D1B7M6_THEAS|nr:nucleoside-diphosphate sugar epimerase/dehydratase [Thermanaerovibrio acidaminovorans]ACZ18279.1 polysaccharide biosynthesis protein CapD [Thermanaerovibrio acidaminovorans DSM 6589]
MKKSLPAHTSAVRKILLDVACALVSSLATFVLRLDLPLPVNFAPSLVPYSILATATKLGLILWLGTWRQSWRNSSVPDLIQLLKVMVAFVVIMSGVGFVLGPANMPLPRGIPFIDGAITLLLWGGIRLLARGFHEREGHSGSHLRPVVIAGAGSAGTSLAREIQRNRSCGMRVAAFLDDDPAKLKMTILGVPVAGTLDQLGEVLDRFGASEVLIAMPSAPGSAVRLVMEQASSRRVRARIIPAIAEVLSGRVSLDLVRDVEVEDLLRREAVRLDLDEIGSYLRGQRVMITGAGGSIGSELVRQAIPFGPSLLVLLGRGENSLHQLEMELKGMDPVPPFVTVVADVRDRTRLGRVIARYRPSVVFHAAAHKHVPMMEEHPEEAVKNNVLGTLNVVECCIEAGVSTLVNISTDKAVNPTSVMGASKRLAEMVVRRVADRVPPGGAYVSVRFGNVLGSRGSVVPLFKEQIRRGGPVTVTDPEMVRYFMTIPEAAQLVLQAGGMGMNGAVFVLDMGEPVRIVDMARDLIRLSGLEPDRDIRIEFTGRRPGEKLYEELLTAEEGTEASRHSKIFVARTEHMGLELDQVIQRLSFAAEVGDQEAIRRILSEAIPTSRLEGIGPGGD